MFWAYGTLSSLESICIQSFVLRGYALNLWSYGITGSIPFGVTLRDAREILPESSLFLNRKGSYAGFSDLFRYAVLSKLGGLWADTDVAAIARANELPREAFLVSERVHNYIQINGNVIYNPCPSKGNLIDLAYAHSLAYPRSRIEWSEIGPDLLTALASIIPDHEYRIMPPAFANPIDSHECPQRLLDPSFAFNREPAFVHLYNERWRMTGTDKNQPYPAGCIMDFLQRTQTIKEKEFPNPVEEAHLVMRKARLVMEPYPPLLLRRLAELFGTLGKWSHLCAFQRFADWLWQIGIRS
jgi:Glycosyltransferase sugar-binding region containing DXD motif